MLGDDHNNAIEELRILKQAKEDMIQGKQYSVLEILDELIEEQQSVVNTSQNGAASFQDNVYSRKAQIWSYYHYVAASYKFLSQDNSADHNKSLMNIVCHT